MTIRTKQLLQIKEATHSTICTWESEAEKTLMQSLKQFHTHFYRLYEKGMTQSMVSLQGLNTSDAFRCSNISASMGLKSFFPWCLNLGGTLKQSPSILERFITEWWLCAKYASLLPACPGLPLWVQSQEWQGMCGTGGTGQGEEITQKEVQVPGKKGDILTTQIRGYQRIKRVECHSLPPV